MAFEAVTYAAAKGSAKTYTDSAIEALGKGMDLKGTVASYANLPLTGNTKGDVYIVSDTHLEYVWPLATTSGALTDWEQLGGSAYSVTIDI